MKAKIILTATLLISSILFSCKQDPIFYIISKETAPKKPRISGSPTNMVVFEREYTDPDTLVTANIPVLYVASGKLHWFAKGTDDISRWDSRQYSINQPGGRIIDLAVTSDYLYALCLASNDLDTVLKRIGPTESQWTSIGFNAGKNVAVQTIQADSTGEWLFAGALNRTDNVWPVFYLGKNDTALKSLTFPDDDDFSKHKASSLSGTVYRDSIYYLSFSEGGIMQVDETELQTNVPPAALPLKILQDNSAIDENKKSQNRKFTGMLKLEDTGSTIIAIERDGGAFFKVEDGSLSCIKLVGGENPETLIATGRYATSAHSLWQGSANPDLKLLLVGIQSDLYGTSTTSYTFGYVEFKLNTDGSLDLNSNRLDPNLTVIENPDNYMGTLGKHPINHLFQAPAEIDDNMTLFASTQTVGLWSYRNRPGNGGWQWNAEE